MAFRTWAKLLGATLGVAALAGASQLGVAYGLGILRLTRVLDVTTRDQWTAQLAWVAWFAMMAAVIGALAGGRLGEQAPAVTLTYVALAVAAGVGAAVVVPLTMQPARTAQVAGVHPVFAIGLCAGLGALFGAIAAYAALTQLVARWSMTLMGVIIWVIALVSVAPSLAPTDPLPAVRLGVFDAGFLAPSVTQRMALFTMPAVALLLGAALGWAARRRGMSTMTIALAGLPGPALLTLSYLIAGPGSGSGRYQVVPYWAAMTAVGAGVLGSVLAAVLRRGGEPEAEPGDADGLDQQTAESPAPGKPADRIPDQRAAPDLPGGDGPGRRSSAADAFTARTGEWATRRSDPPPQRADGPPSQGTAQTGMAHTGVALGEYARAEPQPFDAFRKPPPRETPAQPARPEPQPYVPAPAIPPMPPEAIQEPPPARGGGLRGRMPSFGRNRNRGPKEDQSRSDPEPPVAPEFRAAPPGRGPLVPEPQAVSAPLPQPDPVTPPLPVTPAPPRATPAPLSSTPLSSAPLSSGPLSSGPLSSGPLTSTGPQGDLGRPGSPAPPDGRRGRRQRTEDEFVDWVSGLGSRADE